MSPSARFVFLYSDEMGSRSLVTGHSRAHRHNAQYISSHQQFLILDSANIHWCQFHYRKADVIKGNMSRIPNYGSLLRPAASTGSEQTVVWNMRPAICMRLASRFLAVL